MTRPGETLAAVQALLREGETAAPPLASLASGVRYGLWYLTADGKRCVASAALAHLAAVLPNRDEAAAAIFACEDRYRVAWWGLVAARLKDAGRRRDVAELSAGIDQVGPASEVVRVLLPQAALKPTGFAELETLLFGAPAEQAVAGPRLLRALGAAAGVIEGGRGTRADVVSDLNPLDPRTNWVRGRLIRLPSSEEPPRVGATAVLPGGWPLLTPAEVPPNEPPRQSSMRWVLHRPWAFLLAQIVFTQEAWAAERIEGGVALELDDAQLVCAHRPYRVEVVITNRDGDEVVCGSLGEMLHRVLSFLGVSLLEPLPAKQLDDRLGELIRVLQEKRVWRFDARAASGRRPGYFVHEDFSDNCYRAFGSNHFYRLGGTVTGAIRSVCEGWARERLGEPRSADEVRG